MDIISLIASNNYIIVNKAIAKMFGLDAAVVLGELASEQCYWRENNGIDDEGFFFSTVENIENATTLSGRKQRACIAALEQAGIVQTKLKGLPAKRYFKIDPEKLVENMQIKLCENGTTSCAFSSHLDVTKCNSNNNNNNNNNNNIEERKNAKQQPKKNSFDEIIEVYTQDEEIRQLLREWLKVRKAKRAAMTDAAIQMNIAKLDRLASQSNMTVKQYLEEIICRGWNAFYPIQQQFGSSKPAASKEHSFEVSDLEKLMNQF